MIRRKTEDDDDASKQEDDKPALYDLPLNQFYHKYILFITHIVVLSLRSIEELREQQKARARVGGVSVAFEDIPDIAAAAVAKQQAALAAEADTLNFESQFQQAENKADLNIHM